MNGRYQISYHPSTLSRTDSYIDITDIDKNHTRTFHPQEVVGKGEYGFVRRFSDGISDIAVKAPNEKYEYSDTEKEAAYRRLRVKAEYQLMRAAYPENSLCYMTDVPGMNKPNTKHGKPIYHYSYRIVDHFNHGQTLYRYLKKRKFKNAEQFARLVLRAAQALHAIHHHHVIHGDVAARNIMLEEMGDDYNVKFIDFGLGYKLNGNAVVGFYDVSDYGEIAPERVKGIRLPADPVQDVYSFAYLVKTMYDENMNQRTRRSCKKLFPSILTLMEDGLRKNPLKRPDLSTLIDSLRYKLDWEGISLDLFNLAIALEDADKCGFTKANKITEANPDNYQEEHLTELLVFLIEHNEYKIACHLIDFTRNSIPINFYMLYAAAEQPEIHKDFLLELISCLTPEQKEEILTKTAFNKNTLLHAAASAGNMTNVQLLMENGLDLLQKNSNGMRPADVAHPDIKPIVQLLTFIASHDKQKTHSGRLFHGKHQTHTVTVLAAANYLADAVDKIHDLQDIDRYMPTITQNKELHAIYQALIEKNLIQEPSRGIINTISKYLSF